MKVALTELKRSVSNVKRNSALSNKVMSTKETAKTTRMPVRPFTASWDLRHIRESPIETALTQLRVWAPNSQEKLNELLVRKIKNLLSAMTKPQAAIARLQLLGTREMIERLNQCIDKVKSVYKEKEEVPLYTTLLWLCPWECLCSHPSRGSMHSLASTGEVMDLCSLESGMGWDRSGVGSGQNR